MLPVVRVMSRLGLVVVTAIMTVLSAFLSLTVAWLLGFLIDVPNYHVHLLLAFVIPFFVTPCFSALTALSMRELQRARRRASEMALLDPLTGIANRRAFFDGVARRLQSAEGPDSHGVLYIDIDHFKQINDRHGHRAGDVVLKQFGDLLRSSTRRDDLVARIGGEEFVVHAMAANSAGLATLAAGITARARAASVEFEGAIIRYTVSIGGACGSLDTSIDQLMSLADGMLYDVKSTSRDNAKIAAQANAPTDQGEVPAQTRRVRAA